VNGLTERLQHLAEVVALNAAHEQVPQLIATAQRLVQEAQKRLAG